MKLDVTWVAPKLWIGSQAQPGPHLREAGFQVLVLCAQEWQPPEEEFPGVRVHHAPFDDSAKGLTEREAKIAHRAAQKTIGHLLYGQRCLVTCMAGRNRSGLVLALALAGVSGLTPKKAGEQVRAVRPNALTNTTFCDHLAQTKVVRANVGCELCDAKILTRRHHEDLEFWVADCKQCRVPMAVYRPHGLRPSHRTHERMALSLLEVSDRLRPGQKVKLTDDMKTEPRHFHMHARPA